MGNHKKRKIVVTGMGIISSLGNNKEEVWNSLKNKQSAIAFNQEYKDRGLNCHLTAKVKFDDSKIDYKIKRTIGTSGVWAYASFVEAIEDAGLTSEILNSPKVGIVAGTGAGSLSSYQEGIDAFLAKGIKGVSPFVVNKIMGSSVSANLSTLFKTKGVSYSISSACATGAHCVGHASELIASGKQDIVIAGSSEEEHWSVSMGFDLLRVLSNKGIKPFDKNRDGIVLTGGAAFVVLEEKEHAKKRGAKIYAELTGYGYNSDGFNLVAPSLEGPLACMEEALSMAGHDIDYINAHGTGTPVGDVNELECISTLFKKKKKKPFVSSTKSLSGHALGAAGSQEIVYSLLMLKNNLLIGPAIENPEDLCVAANVLKDNKESEIKSVMSNSFGFGGTNACVIFKKTK
jgi:3-oxoacyl-[acyl-carrier-protein] synthase-1